MKLTKSDARREPTHERPTDVPDRYGQAIDMLHQGLRGHPGIAFLEQKLVTECEEARNAVDVHAAARARDRRSLKEAPKVAAAAKTIARYMRDFPHHSNHALWLLPHRGIKVIFRTGAFVPNSNGHKSFVQNDGGLPYHEECARFCEQLAICVVEDNLARYASSLHSVARAGAIFEGSIDTPSHRKPPSRPTILAFHLVWWLRAVTSSPEAREIQVFMGDPMPKRGRPHYAVAEEFVAAAFAERFDVRRRLIAHKGMQYFRWN